MHRAVPVQLLEARNGWASVRHWRVQNQMDVISRIPYWCPPVPCLNDWQHAQTRHIWLRRGGVLEKQGEILLASSGMNSLSSFAACASSTAVAARVAFQSVYVGVESKTGTRATRTTPWNLSVATMPVDDHFHVTTELV